MSIGIKRYDNFDDIVFKVRNKEYGAFMLRKKYNRNVLISLLIGIMLMVAAISIPYLNARSLVTWHEHSEKQVVIVMQDLNQPHELVAPPPPPPASSKAIQQVKYVPPVVVDSIKLEDTAQGGISLLHKYIADNTRYPVVAKENNIQGKVYVRFCVTAKGAVEQVSILKGVESDLDAEAIRVVKTFPPFKPGKQDGKPVPVWFSISINFQL